MDCKPESAARTFFRIALISIQGALMGLVGFVMAILFIPFASFVLTVERWCHHGKNGGGKGLRGFLKRLAMTPLWILQAVCISLIAPFSLVVDVAWLIRSAASVEWKMRWIAAMPKTPDGHPIPIDETLDR